MNNPIFKLHLFLLSLIFYKAGFSQCVNPTSKYTSAWDIYSDDLCTMWDGTQFILGNPDLTIWNAQDPNNLVQITNPTNDWRIELQEIAEAEMPAIDILLTAQIGAEYFQGLSLPDFYVGGSEAYINTDIGPSSCNGTGGGCYGPGIHYPEIRPCWDDHFLNWMGDPEEDENNDGVFDVNDCLPPFGNCTVPNQCGFNDPYLRPETIAHEFGHRIINENFTQFNGGGSELEALNEFVADIIGMLVEGEVTGTIDWTHLERDYSQLAYKYDDTNYNSLGKYRQATIGGHWFYLVSESSCFNPGSLLQFLFASLNSQNPPGGTVVCTYPTLRDATLALAYQQFGDCNDCYEVIADAWNTVGVGSKYAPDVPTVVASNAGPCNYYLEWADQGIEGYNIKLYHYVQGEWVEYTQYFDFCTQDNFATFEMLPSGTVQNPENYKVEIRPVCDLTNCTQTNTKISTNLFTDHPFEISGDGFFSFDGDPNVDLFTATNCNIIVGPVPNQGLDPAVCYRFRFEEVDINGMSSMNLVTPTDIIMNDGNVFFVFGGNQLEIFQNMAWEAEINYRCPDMFQDAGDGQITQVPALFDDFNIQTTNTKCQISAQTNFDFEHENDRTRFNTRIMRLTQAELDEINMDPDLLNSDRCLANYFRDVTRTEISGFEPEFPIVSTPFGDPNQAASLVNCPAGMNPPLGCQAFIINMTSEGFHNNPAHPFFPEISCSSRSESDCIIRILPSPTDCNIQPQMDLSYCIENSQLVLEFFPLNFNINDISHIAYRIQDPETGVWMECNEAITTTVILDEPFMNQNGCANDIIVQAVPVCDCTQNCADNWNAQNVVMFPDQGDNIPCNPPMLIDAEHFPDQITIQYELVPGVYGYRFFTTPLTAPPSNPGVGQILCPPNTQTCLNMDGNITVPINQMTEYTGNHIGVCPVQGTTGRLMGPDILPSESYLVYVQAICCDNGVQPTCDDIGNNNAQLNLPANTSDCVLAIEVGPACNLPNQTIQTQVLSATSILVTWIDPDPTEYTIYAQLADCNNEIFSTLSNDQITVNGNTVSAEFVGLMPQANFTFMISKDCSTLLCSDCSSSISSTTVATTFTFPNPTFSGIICTDVPGEITMDLAQTGWDPTMYDLVIDGTGNPQWDGNNLTFFVTESGPHTIYIPNGLACSPNWTVPALDEYVCTIELNATNSNCSLEYTYDCDDGNTLSWIYTDPSGLVQELSLASVSLSSPPNGTYQLEIFHPDCDSYYYSEEVLIDCDVDPGKPDNFDCEGDPDYQSYYVDATISGMNNISDWIAPNSVPSGFRAVPSDMDNINLVIKGFLRIDIPIEMTDCLVEFEKASGLNVYSELTGDGTDYINCSEDIWSGIQLINANSSIHLSNNCTIQGANTGLRIATGSELSISDTDFINNRYGISRRTAGTINTQGTFSNVTFTAGENGKYGIFMNDFTFKYHDNETSTFNDYGVAIKMSNSSSLDAKNILINGGIFGVLSEDESILTKLENANFEDNDLPILFRNNPGGTLTLDNITINSNNESGLRIKRSDGAIVTVNGFVADGCNTRAISLSSSMFDSAVISDVDITGGETGISINRCNNVSISGGTIDGLSNPWPSGQSVHQGHAAIESWYSHSIEIENITMDVPSDHVNGIFSYDGGDISIRDNEIDPGSGIFATAVKSSGINGMFICGNTFYNAKTGSQFYNISTNGNGIGAKYILNDHNNNDYGIRIYASPIGENPHAGNTYTAMTGGYVYGDPDLSEFEVNSHSSNLTPDENLTNDFDIWFPFDPTGTSETSECNTLDGVNGLRPTDDPDCCCPATPTCPQCCPDPVYPDCEEILRLLQRATLGMNSSSLSPSALYQLQMNILRRQLAYLGPYTPIEEIYKDCLEEIENYEGQFLEGNLAQRMQNQTNLHHLHHQARNISGQVDLIRARDDFLSKMGSKGSSSASLSQAKIALADAIAQYRGSRGTSMNDIIEALDAVELTPNDIVSYHEKMLEIEAFLAMNEVEDLPEMYVQIITSLASQCAYDYGHPVYFSRILLQELGLSVVDAYDDELLCGGIDRRERKSPIETTHDIQLYPNPAKATLNLRGKDLLLYSQLSITNTDGSVYIDRRIEGEFITLNVDELSAGIYFVLLAGGDNSIQKRFVLVD